MVAGQSGLLDARLRSGGDDGITVHVNNVIQKGVWANTAVVWGVPGEHGTGAP